MAARPTVFGNHKGGVGKTQVLTLTAAELAKRRRHGGKPRRVLCIDLDPQGNLTRRMGYLEEQIEQRPSMAEVIQTASPEVLQSCLLPCQWEGDWADNITLAPSRIELENRVPEAGIPGSHLRLRKALTPLLDHYDDVLIDAAPTLGHLLHLSLASVAPSTDGHGVNVIAVMTPNYDGLRGVRRLDAMIGDPHYQLSLNMRARFIGVVINQVRTNVLTHKQRTDEAITTWGSTVWTPHLHLSAGAERAVEFSEPPQAADDAKSRIAMQIAAESYVDNYLAAIGEHQIQEVTN
ncbi:ParA family protein [Nocardia pseudovaccinii]|uniref:ParA family protein n=1 Tax=Nocardia pseudovaccinii TaxID=189540 RepID=UPI0007A50E03|nr:ParA family protein [Nocardia pseudovaccinii]